MRNRLLERLNEIVDISFKLLQNKIDCDSIDVYNEASLQLQFSVILKIVGQLFEYSKNEKFSIELEKKLENIKTLKSTGTARCDIWLTLTDGNEYASIAIELKYFPHVKGETTTDNRFGILKDIQNLEAYKCCCDTNQYTGYVIVFTNNPTYSNPNTRSYINIGDKQSFIKSDLITLSNLYTFNWINENKNNYFLKVKVN